MIIHWHTDLYKNFRKKVQENTDLIAPGGQSYLQKIIDPYGGKIIEVRKKPPSIREVTDWFGMNDRYAIKFDNEQDALLFVLRWG